MVYHHETMSTTSGSESLRSRRSHLSRSKSLDQEGGAGRYRSRSLDPYQAEIKTKNDNFTWKLDRPLKPQVYVILSGRYRSRSLDPYQAEISKQRRLEVCMETWIFPANPKSMLPLADDIAPAPSTLTRQKNLTKTIGSLHGNLDLPSKLQRPRFLNPNKDV